MKQLWYRCWHWLCARIYFERITLLQGGKLPECGPTLYIVLHRNGAVDGFVYHQVVPRGVFLVSTQLLRGFFSRLFFCGIAVARKQDEGDRSQNEAALRECVELLKRGGELVVFPEGTSSLGPRHLPFKSGAASMALDALVHGIPLRVVPLGIHYECAWAFRSRIEIVVGEPVSTEFSAGLGELGKLKEMKRRMTTALEAVGANFESAETQETAEKLAYMVTQGTRRSYYSSLKVFESGLPELLLARWRDLMSGFSSSGVLLHQGVPLFPAGPWLLDALLLLVLGPVVLAGATLNFPPLLAGWLAARRFADDRNVIALWRILVGLPLMVVWSAAVAISLAYFTGWFWLAGYIILTIVSLESLDRTKKLVVTVWNGLRHRNLARSAWGFHQDVLKNLPQE